MGERRAKVIHIITRMVRGGAQLVVFELLRGLDPKRFEVHLVSGDETGSEGSLWQDVEGLPVTIHQVPDLGREIQPSRDWRATQSLRKLIRSVRPAIVHSHTSKAGLLGSWAARQEGVPSVVLSPHGHILGGGARIPGVPQRGLKRRVLAHAARLSAQLSDVVVAPNEVERHEGIALGMWSEPGSITVPNGVDTDRFAPRSRSDCRRSLGLAGDQRHVGVVARLTTEKGIDIAVSALAACHRGGDSSLQLHVIGSGPEREALVQQARAAGIEDAVHFHGELRNVEAWLPAFDAVWIPSRTEAHGMVAAEALACGCPVVASDVGGLRSLVIPERTGVRVPVGDVEALARATRELRERHSWRQRLGNEGRRWVLEEYSLQRMIERTEALYEKLLQLQQQRWCRQVPLIPADTPSWTQAATS